jgi:uncharacterized protein (DUF2237 family)
VPWYLHAYGRKPGGGDTRDDGLIGSRSGGTISSPPPQFHRPGLKARDRWCLYATRRDEARLTLVAPQVVRESTHVIALELVDMAELEAHESQER